MTRSAHRFHIPVMGTGFTIDTPLRVGRYGISSVISLVDDLLIEQMRRYHCEQNGEPYEEISSKSEDSRAKRITAYLDLIDRLLEQQVRELQASPFEKGAEITRYYEMLPDSPLKEEYQQMLTVADAGEKARRQKALRAAAIPGKIDVNIMTKLDRDQYRDGQKLPADRADAMAALRGYANSTLSSSIVFSAGLNTRLYGSLSEFPDFFPDDNGLMKKEIILKVSDFRSAMVQGKYFAKRGLWVSEFRIESGLNCGGHAFATDGILLGPILKEFKQRRAELQEKLGAIYKRALTAQEKALPSTSPQFRVTVQGAITTSMENDFLLHYYEVDATGWGTPFLLVPEAALVDDTHIEKMLAATGDDVYMSEASPLGVPFWNLRTSASEEARRQRNAEGTPGSVCPKKHLAFNCEFSKIPLCTASKAYLKMREKAKADPSSPKSTESCHVHEEALLKKSCICNDLAGGALRKLGIDLSATPAICCGPNILSFKRIATLEEMVGHIYGWFSLLADPETSHVFVREAGLYVDYLYQEAEKLSRGVSTYTKERLGLFRENLLAGLEYYQQLAEEFNPAEQNRFRASLDTLRKQLSSVPHLTSSAPSCL